MKTSVLKPGLLVSLSVRVKGGVSYARRELAAGPTTNGEQVSRWETERTIHDPEEWERAGQARSLARSLVSGVCCPSTFGLLCPVSEEAALDAGVTEAREVAERFNASAAQSRVEVFVLVGRIAQDDAEAARAIGAEVRELLEAMQAGIKAADPEAIREAANKARAIGGMLTEDVGAKVDAAIAEARKAAREIVRRVAKSGEQAAAVVGELNMRALDAARFAFLDTDAPREARPEAPAARGLDLEPSGISGPLAALGVSRELEL